VKSQQHENLGSKPALRRALATLVCGLSVTVALPAVAGVQKTSSEFGAYTEDALVYRNDAARQYGEWSEYVSLYNHGDWWGNSTFGAGYNSYATTSAVKTANTASTDARAELTTDVKIFGYNIDIVDIYTAATTHMRPAFKSASFSVYVKGSQVYSRSASGSSGWSWGQSLFSFERTQTFSVAGYPVKVTAGVEGDASLSYWAGVEPTYTSAHLSGRAGLHAHATGAVGASWLVGAKAWANLTLVEPRLDNNAVQSWELRQNGGQCDVTLWRGTNAALTVNSLKGNVKAQAQLVGFTETGTIFEWDGFTRTYNILPNTMTARVVTDNFACPTVGN
jgi:hypothetical protein